MTSTSMSSPLPSAWRTVTPSARSAGAPWRALPSRTTTTGCAIRPELAAARTVVTKAPAAPARSRHHPVGRDPTTLAASIRSTLQSDREGAAAGVAAPSELAPPRPWRRPWLASGPVWKTSHSLVAWAAALPLFVGLLLFGLDAPHAGRGTRLCGGHAATPPLRRRRDLWTGRHRHEPLVRRHGSYP